MKDLMTNTVITSTMNYGLFNLVDSNRKLKSGNVQKLMNSFKMTQGMSRTKPIIVDKKFNVIDGQHRLEACKRMGIPVHYIVTDEKIKNIPLYNTYQEKWNLDDYANFWAKNGIRSYINIIKIKEIVGFSVNACLEGLGIFTGKEFYNNFKNGNFICDIIPEQAIEAIRNMVDLSYFITGKKSINKKITRAVRFLRKAKDFDYQVFISRIKRFPDKIHLCATTEGYIDMFIELYNYHIKTNRFSADDILTIKNKEV